MNYYFDTFIGAAYPKTEKLNCDSYFMVINIQHNLLKKKGGGEDL
jgi:hypothetical protein